MFRKVLVSVTIFAIIQCQVMQPKPYPRSGVIPSAPCSCQAPPPPCPCQAPFTVGPYPPPGPIRPAYEVPVPIVANPPIGCLEAGVTNYGGIAEVALAGLPGLPVSPLANPFLPAASPVSAMLPFSPLLPPANTCSRCQYLKKIPIPPPYI